MWRPFLSPCSYSCTRDTVCSWPSLKITLLNPSARDHAKHGANPTTDDEKPSSSTMSILSWQERRWARNVERGERVRPRPEMGHRQSSLMSQQLWEAIRYLDKPRGYPNWQRWAQSHLYSLSSGVRHHYRIYLSWYAPVRKGPAAPF